MLEQPHASAGRVIRPAPLEISLREPLDSDGPAVSELVRACPPLDRNSRYCNLLQCTDFSDTCVLAEADAQPVGWVSGYRPPQEDDTLFVWQVAVHPVARGAGLGKKMMLEILRRPACAEVTRLKTTVTPDNDASRAMFESLADRLDAGIRVEPHFERRDHFENRQASEHLITIGRFAPDAL